MVRFSRIIETFRVSGKIVNNEFGLADTGAQAATAAAHLGIFDGRFGRPQHDQVFYLLVIIARIQHIY